MDSKHTWTEEIKSQDSLFSINLRELWHYRDLLLMLLKRDFITFYKQTILGPIWFVVQPLLTTAVYLILFAQVAKIAPAGVPPIAFYLSGVTIWNYFSDSLSKTSTVFKDNAAVFGKVYFPRLIMPLSIVFSGLLKFLVQFCLFIVVVLYYTFVTNEIHPNIWMLATPILLLLMAAFALGLGMIFSSMTTKYKDLVFLLTFGIQLFMYATPVVYTIDKLPEKYRWIVEYNPLTGIFDCFRYAYLGMGNFNPSSLIYSTGIIAVLLFLGIVIFNKVQKSFMDTV
ncbi:MAG TPA: ABC transporter permease [Flavobacterium sp.]|nr:ABC transporter permease [Flavobacterium sp.]